MGTKTQRQKSTTTDCICESCRRACVHKPGWFKAGEAEQAAALMGLSVADFFARYLAVDYWVADAECPTTFVLSPAAVGVTPGDVWPVNPQGRCVFLTTDRLCQIHAAKPYECRASMCGDSDDAIRRHKAEARDSWRTPKAQQHIRELLNAEPEVPSTSIFDALLDVWPFAECEDA